MKRKHYFYDHSGNITRRCTVCGEHENAPHHLGEYINEIVTPSSKEDPPQK